jgi:hypothetical protein
VDILQAEPNGFDVGFSIALTGKEAADLAQDVVQEQLVWWRHLRSR